MGELGPSPEQEPRYMREQVLQVLAGLVAKGYDHPDALPLEGDPEVSAAQQAVDAWRAQELEAAAKSLFPVQISWRL
ncbi:MAG TPA: hypothetical protein VMT30_01660 [Candidatus Saccharimonadia bacterium]|nr:hypothetical protein [Candidatus Saccharimonadia bacterium]